MSQLPNVCIVLARCQQHKRMFGIRFEEKLPSQWTADWAFDIEENSAQREHYHQSEIKGRFDFDQAYPGCPLCEASSIFQCSCGKIACWDGQSQRVACPWCSSHVMLSGSIRSLFAGGDR